MFAFAIWDAAPTPLFLARDRYGVKPLYWCYRDGRLRVRLRDQGASSQHPRCRRQICTQALNEYFTFQNIFTDLTLFEGIRLLPPGAR